MTSRFKYYQMSQLIEDKKTGRRYYGNQQVTDLLNELYDTIIGYEDVMRKYEIDSVEKLDMCLREQRVW